jgi:hypothetical protein
LTALTTWPETVAGAADEVEDGDTDEDPNVDPAPGLPI